MTSSAEKFEILSAYLDDEASLEECRLVKQWLECDPLFRQQYQAQLRLKIAIRSLGATQKSSHALPVDNLSTSKVDRASNNTSNTSVVHTRKPSNHFKLGAKRKPVADSYTAIACQGKSFVILAAVLSAVSLTAFSYSTLRRSSEWKPLRGISVMSSEADEPSRQIFRSAVESH